ncbi:hypothetical protein [Oceanibacterium hippocampi]|uniref:hypothetical protein n=1 Tax=Oceanibacterium hippocampi TaxID=745714 RepID=UPI00111C1311|nr:hypothetical protein [Oceanibacterium hippocampi]
MSEAPETDPAELWRFVPLGDYARPERPTASATAHAWSSLKSTFRMSDGDENAPTEREKSLRALAEVRLEHLVRPFDWTEVSTGLDTALTERAAPARTSSASFVIGQPHCGHAGIVEAWASRHGAQVIDPPSHEEILAGDPGWRPSWPEAGQLWAIPRLEHCFLRHANGLVLVRRLLEDVACGRAGRGLIGCDSWAWAFLRHVWPIPQPEALTLEAFDGTRLARLFSLLAAPEGGRQLSFRHARTGRETLAVPAADNHTSDELIRLAAHCRGNPGTARSYWRARLRAEPETEARSEDSETSRPDGTDDSATVVVWVSADLPEPSLKLDEDTILFLHALLLHNGLTVEALNEVLPMPLFRSNAIAERLRSLDLLERRQGRWIVSALGYTLTREWLRTRDFLIDDF